MKITKLHYFDTYEIFQGNRRFTKLGFEAELDTDHDNLRDCYYDLKRKSEELFYESKAAAEKQMGTQVKDVMQNTWFTNEEILARENETDIEWQQIKDKLSKIKWKEEAQEYLDTTKYNMLIEAKQIINQKKSKQ
jgi:hypothetical protein